jgi:hypothetical protein
MSKIRQVCSVTAYNFRQWYKNPRIIITFALAFILCFLLSNKAVSFAHEYKKTMQIFEAFVWTFADSNSIMLSSLLLVLLFADMPFLSAGTPFYLMRINRTIWLLGQALYIVLATGIYMAFILLSTSVLSVSNSFAGNMWSETAAILGYSGAGQAVALPALVKTLEMSTPYACTGTIFLLMLLYTLLMDFIMLTFNISKGQVAGVISVFVFSLFGFLLNPELFKTLFQLPDVQMYKANVAVGWLSPLNQATYSMHNFGYDLLPRLWQTYVIFGVLIALFSLLALRAIRKYNFNFTGTEGS